MPFDDAAEAKCADSESEDEYVESRLERVGTDVEMRAAFAVDTNRWRCDT